MRMLETAVVPILEQTISEQEVKIGLIGWAAFCWLCSSAESALFQVILYRTVLLSTVTQCPDALR